MHRAFITARDYEAYEADDTAARHRKRDRESELAAHGAYDKQKPILVGDDETRAINARFGIPDTYDRPVPDRYRPGPVTGVDASNSELSDSPNLPHRDDKGVSKQARYSAWKVRGYADAIDATEKPTGEKRTYHGPHGSYFVPDGLNLTRRNASKSNLPHKRSSWGKPLTSGKKYLAYWRDPTGAEAIRNVTTSTVHRTQSNYVSIEVERGILLMWTRLHEILVTRGIIQDEGRSAAMWAVVNQAKPGETLTLEVYTKTDLGKFVKRAPKMYRKGAFGAFLKNIATQAKLEK